MSSTALQALARAVHENRITADFDLASIAVLVYDYILTFKLEVGLVWATPWNMGRILYSLTTYCVFVDSSLLAYFHFAGGQMVSARTCSLVYQISGCNYTSRYIATYVQALKDTNTTGFIFWGGSLAEVVLIFRTWGIWGQSRKVAVGLAVLLVVVVVPLGHLTKVGLTAVKFVESPVPHIQSCFVIANNDITILWDYVVILAFETVILVLTLIKGVQDYRHTSSGLVSTLYEDGILYYIYLLALSIANVLFLVFLEQKSGASLILMQRVFHSILTRRIILHLRLAIVRDRRDLSTSATPPNLTTIRFTCRSCRTELSTGIIGADVWVHDHTTEPVCSGQEVH